MLDRLKAGAVVIARELGVFNECALGDEIFEGVGIDKVVILALGLAWTWLSGRI